MKVSSVYFIADFNFKLVADLRSKFVCPFREICFYFQFMSSEGLFEIICYFNYYFALI